MTYTATTNTGGPFLVWSAPVMARHLGFAPTAFKPKVGTCNSEGWLFPPPDAKVGEHRGWLPNRDDEIRAWLAGEPVPTRPAPTAYLNTREWAEQLGIDLRQVRQWWYRFGQPLLAGTPAGDNDAPRRLGVPRPDVFLLLQPNRFDQNPSLPGWLPARIGELRAFSESMAQRAGGRKKAPHGGS